jgi:hypothetical protein
MIIGRDCISKLRPPTGPTVHMIHEYWKPRWNGSDRENPKNSEKTLPTFYVSILRIPQMIWVWWATVEWYRQEKTEEPGEKPVPVPLCPPRIPHGLTRAQTRASAVRGRRLTTWAMARPPYWLYCCLLSENLEIFEESCFNADRVKN